MQDLHDRRCMLLSFTHAVVVCINCPVETKNTKVGIFGEKFCLKIQPFIDSSEKGRYQSSMRLVVCT